jgi:hemolysin III
MRPYTPAEEVLNSITHGIGVIFGIVAVTVLCVLSAHFGTFVHTVSYLVYGCSLIILYTSSTLYHALPSPRVKRLFKIFDHSSIYLLIAGTYTPFLILNLKNDNGSTLLVIIWSLALMGVIFKVFFTGRFKVFSTLLYIGMGWLIVFAYGPMKANLRPEGLWWLIAGGLAYTLGTAFYLAKETKFTHAIWHLFVLAGSIFHFIAIIYGANFSY